MKQPMYAISSTVPAGNRVTHFHGHEEGSAAWILMKPPTFRYAGFDLSTSDVAREGPDGSLEIGGTRKLLRLFQDGTLVARVPADAEFLGWGVEPGQFWQFPRLNPVAVTEVHASFAYLCSLVVKRLKNPPKMVRFKLRLINGVVSEQRLLLTKHVQLQNVDPWTLDRYLLHSSPAEAEMDIDGSEVADNPQRVSFRLAELFVSFFDMPPQLIPFQKQGADGPEFDPTQLQRISR